jgi:hypothetical protein
MNFASYAWCLAVYTYSLKNKASLQGMSMLQICTHLVRPSVRSPSPHNFRRPPRRCAPLPCLPDPRRDRRRLRRYAASCGQGAGECRATLRRRHCSGRANVRGMGAVRKYVQFVFRNMHVFNTSGHFS